MAKNPDVDDWMADYDNSMKPDVEAIRELVLTREPRTSEVIKWQAPTSTYKGNIASFFPTSKKHASLMFHKGAEIPGKFPNLGGYGKKARTFKVESLADLDAKTTELVAIFTTWCDLKDGG